MAPTERASVRRAPRQTRCRIRPRSPRPWLPSTPRPAACRRAWPHRARAGPHCDDRSPTREARRRARSVSAGRALTVSTTYRTVHWIPAGALSRIAHLVRVSSPDRVLAPGGGRSRRRRGCPAGSPLLRRARRKKCEEQRAHPQMLAQTAIPSEGAASGRRSRRCAGERRRRRPARRNRAARRPGRLGWRRRTPPR